MAKHETGPVEGNPLMRALAYRGPVACLLGSQ